MRFSGKNWAKRELLERVGDISQIAGAERFAFHDGRAEGVQAARVRSGGGLDFTVLFSRGMDIDGASYRGIPLAWISPTGPVHPDAYEAEGVGWLRSFHGGLLTTCGLSNVGGPNVDQGEHFGIHGRISHIAAEETRASTQWQGDDAEVVVEGVLREARVFGENLRMSRRFTAPVGGAQIRIEDRVENVGFRQSPLMLLYHLNFGWPLISEDAELVLPVTSTEGRDPDALSGQHNWNRMEAPQAGFAEQVFYHQIAADAQGDGRALLLNRPLGLGVEIRYSKKTLPHLTQWKMMGQGEYVCGVEPGNCRVGGRSAERAAGRLEHLEPGESREFSVTLSVLDGADALEESVQAIRSLV